MFKAPGLSACKQCFAFFSLLPCFKKLVLSCVHPYSSAKIRVSVSYFSTGNRPSCTRYSSRAHCPPPTLKIYTSIYERMHSYTRALVCEAARRITTVVQHSPFIPPTGNNMHVRTNVTYGIHQIFIMLSRYASSVCASSRAPDCCFISSRNITPEPQSLSNH